MPEPKPKFSAYGAPSCAHTMPGQERGLFLLASPFKPVPGELTLWRKAKGSASCPNKAARPATKRGQAQKGRRTMTGTEWTGGSLRLLYSFSAGLLLFRLFKPFNIKGSFCNTENFC